MLFRNLRPGLLAVAGCTLGFSPGDSLEAQVPQDPVLGVHYDALQPGRRHEFKRAWKSIALPVRERRQSLRAEGDFAQLNAHFRFAVPSASTAAASGLAVTGTYSIPVLAGYFADSSQIRLPDITEIQDLLFAPAPAPPYSVTTYYEEVSTGLVSMTGDVIGWFKADSAHTWYGNTPAGDPFPDDHVGDYMKNLLDQAEAIGTDFSQYDADGDGYVDIAVFLHPLRAGECGLTDNIWSHVWNYQAQMGSPYVTDDGVSVDDYVILSAVGGVTGCSERDPMPIGILTHELGHGFALPDLYDYSPPGQGIGHWGLMGSGNWNQPSSPAHMMAWTKDLLGWIAIDTVAPGTGSSTRNLEPIVTSQRALRLDPDGTQEYFLLENRQVLGADQYLHEPGLLVWHIDEARFQQSRNNEIPYGVALVQADGLATLEDGSNRGDRGDPFPGSTANVSFTPTSVPDSRLNTGVRSGVWLTSISQLGDGTISFDLCVELGGVWGDVTADGKVNVIDAQQIARHVAGLQVRNPESVVNRGDIDADGQITADDAEQVARHSIGLTATGRTGEPLSSCAP